MSEEKEKFAIDMDAPENGIITEQGEFIPDMGKGYHKPRRISELIEDDKLFDSTGFSLVKVTKAGKEEFIELPIKSTGVDELQAQLSGKAPKPPVKKIFIKKGSTEAKEMGLNHSKWEQIFDNTDEDYITALEQHNNDFLWQTVIFALDLELKKKDGSLATIFKDRKAVLKSNGITLEHANQIFQDVRKLTVLQEDREDFLSES